MLLAEETVTVSPIVGVIVGIVIWAAIISIIVYAVKHKKKLKENEEEDLQNLELEITKKIEGEDYTIVLDDKNHKFAVKTSEQERFCVYNYSEFIDCEVLENDGQETKTSGNAGKTILGGMFFGGIGALAGMSGKKKQKSIRVIYSISVRILVKDIKTPFYQVDVLDKECKTDSETYEKALKQVGEIVATFNLIKGQNT